MKYSDKGFRPLYKNLCVFPINEKIKELLNDQNEIENAVGVMGYGFVDHIAGNMVEILAMTKKEKGDNYSFIKLSDNARFIVKIDDIMDEEFSFADFGTATINEVFAKKLKILESYDANENLAKSRSIAMLDEFRYEKNFDDVQVYLYREGLTLEKVWVKIEVPRESSIKGILLNDPKQDFGVKAGMPITFFVNESKDKSIQLLANLTPRQKYKLEELADGKMLKDAIIAFNANKNQLNLYSVLEILRDSVVVVPFINKKPDILSSNKKLFFPVFSSSIEMWQYDNNVDKTNMTFLEAINKAQKNTKRVEGIVVNAFSESFVIPKSMFELIEKIESGIID